MFLPTFALLSGTIALLASPILASPLSGNPVSERRTCTTYSDLAEKAAAFLQTKYYTPGHYTGNQWGPVEWTDENAAEDLINLMVLRNETTYTAIPEAVQAYYTSYLTTTTSYDDIAWGIVTALKQRDYAISHGQDSTAFLTRATEYYTTITKGWDMSTCGGGMLWDGAKTYKNSVTTELYLYASALMYQKTNATGMLTNAKTAWTWLDASGLRNAGGLYNDGYTAQCTNNNQTVWIYNQIIGASGLAIMSAVTGDPSYLTAAQVSIDATIATMTVDGILRETCDDITDVVQCNSDQYLFKGIFVKHLGYILGVSNNAALTAKYSGFIEAQAAAVVAHATTGGDDYGSIWYGTDAGASPHSGSSQTSALEAFIAAAMWGTGGAC